MPQISDIVQKRQDKKFIKKNYRPWDLSGNVSELIQSPEQSLDKNIVYNTTPIDFNTSQLDTDQTICNAYKNDKLVPKESTLNNEKKLIDNNSSKDREQLDNIISNNQILIEKQIDINSISNKEQKGSEIENNLGLFREQIDNELNPNSLPNRLIKLSGIQQKILEFVIDICLAKDALETGPIQTTVLTQYVNTSYGSIKISINRLINKGFISRKKGKTAKGGYINLQIYEEVKLAILELRKKSYSFLDPINLVLSYRGKVDNHNNYEQQLDNTSSYSSSNNKTITTELLPEWKNIDIEPLHSIGFSKTQLRQLIGKNAPDIVQESINHYAYGLIHNEKIKSYKDPLNVLMGVLRKGGNWYEANYISPQEQALKQLIADKKERKNRQEAMIKELVDLEYSDWRKELTEEQIKSIVPSNITNLKSAVESVLKSYYQEKIVIPELTQKGLLK